MDGRTDAQITHALDIEAGGFFLSRNAVLAVFHRHLRESNPNCPNVATKYVTAIQGLTCPNGIIKAFKVNESTVFVGENASRFDRAVRTKDAQDCCRCCR